MAQQRSNHKRRERRSELGAAQRNQIGHMVKLAEEQLTNRLNTLEPNQFEVKSLTTDLVTREVDIEMTPHDPFPLNLRMPRQWARDVLQIICQMHLVRIDVKPRPRRTLVLITGRATDVPIAEIAVRKLLVEANDLATVLYRKTFAQSHRKAQGIRQRFLTDYVEHLRRDADRMLEEITRLHGADRLHQLSGEQESLMELVKVAGV